MPELEPIETLPQKIKLDIIYEDDDLLVINKAAGMVVHPAPGSPKDTLVNAYFFIVKIVSLVLVVKDGRVLFIG